MKGNGLNLKLVLIQTMAHPVLGKVEGREAEETTTNLIEAVAHRIARSTNQTMIVTKTNIDAVHQDGSKQDDVYLHRCTQGLCLKTEI